MDSYYDQISEAYGELHQSEQEKKIDLILRFAGFGQGSLILDLGCGPGFLGAFLPRHRLVGLDPSFGLLKQAGFPVVLGVAESLPFCNSAFDHVISLTAMQNFTDPKKAVMEMKRVCDGTFVISVLKRSDKLSMIKSLLESEFRIDRMITQDKDLIFFMRKPSSYHKT